MKRIVKVKVKVDQKVILKVVVIAVQVLLSPQIHKKVIKLYKVQVFKNYLKYLILLIYKYPNPLNYYKSQSRMI
jgi:hypothetical protein